METKNYKPEGNTTLEKACFNAAFLARYYNCIVIMHWHGQAFYFTPKSKAYAMQLDIEKQLNTQNKKP